MKRILSTAGWIALGCLPVSLYAQSSIEASVGFGTANASATGLGIENGSSTNAFGSCVPGASDLSCQSTPKLNGLFMNIAGDIMFTQHFGAGAEISLRPAKGDYGPLQYRQTFTDANLLYAPITRKRWGIQLQGGIGSARTSFSFSQSSCVGTAVCVNQSQAVGAENHFQFHTGAGVEVFMNNHIFVRPQFDYHYVNNFTQQFGSNSVPMFMVSVGYSSSRPE
jgi:hypothetical protein